jgi:hypothetical protein
VVTLVTVVIVVTSCGRGTVVVTVTGLVTAVIVVTVEKWRR